MLRKWGLMEKGGYLGCAQSLLYFVAAMTYPAPTEPKQQGSKPLKLWQEKLFKVGYDGCSVSDRTLSQRTMVKWHPVWQILRHP